MQYKFCNTYFNPLTKHQVYCKRECSVKYISKNRKKFNLICKICNAEFYTKHKDQQYCGLKCSNGRFTKKNIIYLLKKNIVKWVKKVMLSNLIIKFY